jgi:hypothetical protein
MSKSRGDLGTIEFGGSIFDHVNEHNPGGAKVLTNASTTADVCIWVVTLNRCARLSTLFLNSELCTHHLELLCFCCSSLCCCSYGQAHSAEMRLEAPFADLAKQHVWERLATNVEQMPVTRVGLDVIDVIARDAALVVAKVVGFPVDAQEDFVEFDFVAAVSGNVGVTVPFAPAVLLLPQ